MIILRDNKTIEDLDGKELVSKAKGKPSRQSKRKGHVSRKDHKKSPSGRDSNNPKDIADAVSSNDPEDKKWIEEIDKQDSNKKEESKE